jgi:large subunit ribosomal protein L24
MKIKKGDTVLIIAGNDKSRTGKVIKVFSENQKILVEGINLQKRHKRPRKEGEKGQIIEKSGAISISNVKLICPKCNKPAKINITRDKKTRLRVCKNCNQTF